MGTYCLVAVYEIPDEYAGNKQTVFPVVAVLLFDVLPAFCTVYAVGCRSKKQNRNRRYCGGGVGLATKKTNKSKVLSHS